jgi:hypothetical protein
MDMYGLNLYLVLFDVDGLDFVIYWIVKYMHLMLLVI